MYNQTEISSATGSTPELSATPPAVECFRGPPDMAGNVQIIETPVSPSAGSYPNPQQTNLCDQ